MQCYLVNARNQAELKIYPSLHALSFAWLVPRAQVVFSSKPSRNLLCATILDILSTSCAHMLFLHHERS